MMLCLIVLAVTLACPSVNGKTTVNVHHGNVIKFDVVADAFIDNTATNHNDETYLSVGQRDGTNQVDRTLLKFEAINVGSTPDCPAENIRWAKMYIHFNEASDPNQTPSSKEISYSIKAHRVKQAWNEAEVTGIKRTNNDNWATKMLGISTGQDAEIEPQSLPTTIFAEHPTQQFVEFELTSAVRYWAKKPQQNFGVLLYATNELEPGRDLRFTSNKGTAAEHAFIHVMCDYSSSS